MALPGQIPMPSVTQLGATPWQRSASRGCRAACQAQAGGARPAGVSIGVGLPQVAPEAVKAAQMKYLGSHQLPRRSPPRRPGSRSAAATRPSPVAGSRTPTHHISGGYDMAKQKRST